MNNSERVYISNPWRGLASYQDPKDLPDGQSYMFCGRQEATYNLCQIIENNIISTLYGHTGVGKTSLLKAGVFPLMRYGNYYPVYIRLSMFSDMDSYAEVLIKKLRAINYREERKEKGKKPHKNPKKLEKENDSNNYNSITALWDYIHKNRFYCEKEEVIPVLVLDQFEEVLINLNENNKVKIELLLKQLYSLIDNSHSSEGIEGAHSDNNIRIVLSIREDYLFCLEHNIDNLHLEAMKRNRFWLPPLNDAQSREVILTPGIDYIEEGHLGDIVESIVDFSNSNSLILSLTCQQLFEKAQKRNLSCPLITLRMAQGLNNEFLYNYYLKVTSKFSSIERKRFERLLVTEDGRRKPPVPKSSFFSNVSERKCKLLFDGETRLLHMTPSGEVELIHDMVADVIYKHRVEIYSNRLTHWLKKSVVSLLALVFIGALLFEDSKTSPIIDNYYPVVSRIIHKGVWTSDEIVKMDYRGVIDSVVVNDSRPLSFDGCLSLKKIVIDNDTINLRISNCPNLHEIRFTENAKYLFGEIKDCPNLKRLYWSDSLDVESVKNGMPGLLNRDNIEIIIPDGSKKYASMSVFEYNGNKYERIKILVKKKDTSVPKTDPNEPPTVIGTSIEINGRKQVSSSDYDTWNPLYMTKYNQIKSEISSSNSNRPLTFKWIGQSASYGEGKYRDFIFIFDNNSNINTSLPSAYESTDVLIPNSEDIKDSNFAKTADTIATRAFFNCKKLFLVDFSNTKYIDDKAFENSGLVVFRKGDSIEFNSQDGIFTNCDSLRRFHFPRVVKGSVKNLIKNCPLVDSIFLPNYVEDVQHLYTMINNCPNASAFDWEPISHFREDHSGIIFYDNTPAIFNNFYGKDWTSEDSTFYFDNGWLMRDGRYAMLIKTDLDSYKKWKRAKGYYYMEDNSDRVIDHEDGQTNIVVFFYPDKDIHSVKLRQVYGGRVLFDCVNSNTQLKEIHLIRADSKSQEIRLDNQDYSLITLYVPWGCKDSYLSNAMYSNFAGIAEDSFIERIYDLIASANGHIANYNYIFSWYWCFILFALFVVCSLLKDDDDCLLKVGFYVLKGIFVFIGTFYVVFNFAIYGIWNHVDGYNHHESMLISITIATLSSLACLYLFVINGRLIKLVDNFVILQETLMRYKNNDQKRKSKLKANENNVNE